MSTSSPLPKFVSLLPPVSGAIPESTSPAPFSAARHSRLATSQTSVAMLFDALFAAHGSQHWWPGRTRFEVIVGAILTQNTSWKNVELAIANLRRAKLLSPAAIQKIAPAGLARHLRPSGYYRQKTKTLKTFVAFLFKNHGGSLNHLFATPAAALREQLLALRGIGPETADSILLYAGKHPVFVVDAYSRRILERHLLARPKSTYEELRGAFESALPRNHQLFNEFHALIVHTGKHFCRKSDPLCAQCPLQPFLPASANPQITGHQSEERSVLATRRSPLATALL